MAYSFLFLFSLSACLKSSSWSDSSSLSMCSSIDSLAHADLLPTAYIPAPRGPLIYECQDAHDNCLWTGVQSACSSPFEQSLTVTISIAAAMLVQGSTQGQLLPLSATGGSYHRGHWRHCLSGTQTFISVFNSVPVKRCRSCQLFCCVIMAVSVCPAEKKKIAQEKNPTVGVNLVRSQV